MIKLLSEGSTQADASLSTKVGMATVGRVRRRCLEEGLEAAVFSYVASGGERTSAESDESRLVAIACSDLPSGIVAWTLKLKVERAVVSGLVDEIERETVRKILQRHGIKPWLKKMWRVPRLDEECMERMDDVLGPYEKPHSEAYANSCSARWRCCCRPLGCHRWPWASQHHLTGPRGRHSWLCLAAAGP